MTIKDFIILRLQLYFFLVTLILTAEFIIGALFEPDRQLANGDLLGPLILAGLCIIPTFATYFKDEPTSKQVMIRRIIQLILIEAVVQLMATPGDNITDILQFRITIAFVVLVIYIMAYAAIWLRSCRQSEQLTSLLKKFQENA